MKLMMPEWNDASESEYFGRPALCPFHARCTDKRPLTSMDSIYQYMTHSRDFCSLVEEDLKSAIGICSLTKESVM